jgi:hemolysin III
MRGVLHTWGAASCVPLGALLLVLAPTAGSRVAIAIYIVAVGTMLTVSACYHRGRWTDAARAVWRTLDHTTIFLGIAGTYTAVAVLGTTGWARSALLGSVWSAAVLGMALQWLPVHPPRWLFTAAYVATGWCAVIALPQLYRGLGPAAFVVMFVGGLGYTVGAVVYAAKRPDPRPAVFGYHEVFHACTLVGAGCHYATVLLAVLRSR